MGYLDGRHLSYSSVSTYLGCPKLWESQHILGKRQPPSTAQELGSAYHAAQEVNYRQKIDSGNNLSVDDIVNVCAAYITSKARVLRSQQADLIETGERMLRAYYASKLASFIPIKVEDRVERQIELGDGTNVQFIGYVDAIGYIGPVEKDMGSKPILIDHKTSAVPWTNDTVETEDQPTAYTMLTGIERFGYHIVSKSMPTVTQHLLTRRTPADVSEYIGKVRTAASGINRGDFPSNPEYRWCRRDCPSKKSCTGVVR